MSRQHEDPSLSPRPLAYRVQEVPSNWDKTKLKAAFSTVDRPYVTVKSLVPDVMNYGYHNDDGTDTLTATVLFSPPEPRELSLNRKWKADLELDRDFSGFTPLNDPKSDVSGDIIAVTGLAGHAFGSWANSPDRMWLRDFLPSTIPNARVMIYGYRTPLQGIDQPKSILTDHADTFTNDLLTIRHNPACQDRPLVLIGHSLGGLIIKESIANLDEDVLCRLPIRSLVFFGVPHLGLETNGTLASMVKGQPSQTLVNELDRESPTIRKLTTRFMRVLKDAPFIIHSLYESQQTRTVIKNDANQWVREGAPVVMVPQSSATLRHDKEKHAISVKGDHSTMVKLKKGQGSCYPSVSQWIKEDLKNATEVFNGLYNKVQASSNQGDVRCETETSPHTTTLPLLSGRGRVDTPHSSAEYAWLSEDESPKEETAGQIRNRLFSYAEVVRHNKPRDLYIMIHGHVYDVSTFHDEHPGGEQVLFDLVGQDGTEVFEEVGHSDEAREILDGLVVGRVKRHTRYQVAKHNTRKDLFLIINNLVYDCSSFVDEHPYVLRLLTMDLTMFLMSCQWR
ncbi:hypothetical protein BJY00DRAFT_293831 [Aspergillus carlsbadensis]|nr:hypothetical protein BJY00DRAFT_293831 [Aspergillus carlsbadensis]